MNHISLEKNKDTKEEGLIKLKNEKRLEKVKASQIKAAKEAIISFSKNKKISTENIGNEDNNWENESKYIYDFNLKDYQEKLKSYKEQEKAFQQAVELCNDISQLGGKALLVEGSVRDMYLGKISKDYDIEVYGLDLEELENGLSKKYKVENIGKGFPVLGVFTESINFDLSLPRRDSKKAGVEGHRAFDIEVDKNMTIKEAARRRDFTFNTLAMDLTRNKVYDYFNGIEDIKNRVLRVTDRELFGDDPLRVLRAMQFVGRFGFTIDEDSKKIIQETATRVNENSSERFLEEFRKLLLKSEKPSLGLMAAKDLNIFKYFFPHFLEMAKTPQDKDWHPEGDVWVHTLMVVDEAAKIIHRENLAKEQAFIIMLSALLHDVGKPETTFLREDGHVVSPGHEEKGEKEATNFLKKINLPNKDQEKVVKLVTNHMVPGGLYRSNEAGNLITPTAIRRLAKRLEPATIDELILVSEADSFGRAVDIDRNNYKPGEWLREKTNDYKIYENKLTNVFGGKFLRNLGIPEGRIIKDIIETGNRLRRIKETFHNLKDEAEKENIELEVQSLLLNIENSKQALDILRSETFKTIKEIRDIKELK